jgi:hypothetical protein
VHDQAGLFKKVMRTIINLAVGFGLALVGSVIIHAAVLGKRTDVYSLAYCAPQAIGSPVFILNFGYYSQELYHKKRRELERTGREVDRSKILSTAEVQGVLLSGAVTASFWLPFLIFRTRKGKRSSEESENGTA